MQYDLLSHLPVLIKISLFFLSCLLSSLPPLSLFSLFGPSSLPHPLSSFLSAINNAMTHFGPITFNLFELFPFLKKDPRNELPVFWNALHISKLLCIHFVLQRDCFSAIYLESLIALSRDNWWSGMLHKCAHLHGTTGDRTWILKAGHPGFGTGPATN